MTEPIPPRPDFRRTLLTSFAVGLLLGAPLTLAAFLLMHADPEPTDAAAPNPPDVRRACGKVGTPTDVRRQPDPVTDDEEPGGAAGTASGTQRPVLSNGIFWSDHSESLVPRGFDDQDLRRWRELVNGTDVRRISAEACGRMQNRKLVFADGTPSCCRYRTSDDQILGDILSFHLARILGFARNLPPAVLVLTGRLRLSTPSAVAGAASARWLAERPAVVARFVDGLGPAGVPVQLRGDAGMPRRLHPEDVAGLTDASQVRELVQWSDMIVFDYLTANPDRVVNNLHNEAWAPDMMRRPAHNLARRAPDGLLLFLDNESGFAHGYRLLDRYEPMHRSLLDALCVFRRGTVDALFRLRDVGHVLRRALEGEGPASEWLPFLPDEHVRTLRQRMLAVLRQVTRCRSRLLSG